MAHSKNLLNGISLSLTLLATTQLGFAAEPKPMPTPDDLSPEEMINRGAVVSPFKACEKVVLVESSKYQKDLGYWNNLQHACKDKLLVQVVPDTGMFKSFDGQIGKNLSSALTANDFLERVGQRSVAQLEKGLSDLESLRACLSDPAAVKGKFDCEAGKKGFIDNIRVKGPKARQAMAFLVDGNTMDPQKQLAAAIKADITPYINRKLKASDAKVIGPKEQAPLSSEEYALVKAELDGVVAAAKKKHMEQVEKTVAERKLSPADAERLRFNLSQPEKSLVDVQLALREVRTKKEAEYYSLLGEAPQLAYVSDPSISDKDLYKVVLRMLEDGNSALKDMREALNSKKLSLEASEMDKSLLRFAGNTAIIEKMLQEENARRSPTSCAVATAALNELMAAKGQASVVAAVGLLTAPLGVGALGPRLALLATGGKVALGSAAAGTMAVGMGIAGGSFLTAHDIKLGSEAERNVSTGLTKPEDAKADRDAAQLAAITSPLNLIGAKGVIGGAIGGAGWLGKVAFGKYLQSGKNEALSLLKAAEAGDQAALAKIQKITDGNAQGLLGRKAASEDKDLLDAMGSKGLLGKNKPDSDFVKEYGAATKGMKPAERKAFAKHLQETFAKVNPLPENATAAQIAEFEARSKLVTKVGLGFARNGVKDPEEISKLLNDKEWTNEALQGVDRVLSKSRASLKSRIEAGVSEDVARAESLQDSIAQLKYGKPYNQLDDASRAEANKMCQCIHGCPVAARASIDGLFMEPVYKVCAVTQNPFPAL